MLFFAGKLTKTLLSWRSPIFNTGTTKKNKYSNLVERSPWPRKFCFWGIIRDFLSICRDFAAQERNEIKTENQQRQRVSISSMMWYDFRSSSGTYWPFFPTSFFRVTFIYYKKLSDQNKELSTKNRPKKLQIQALSIRLLRRKVLWIERKHAAF